MDTFTELPSLLVYITTCLTSPSISPINYMRRSIMRSRMLACGKSCKHNAVYMIYFEGKLQNEPIMRTEPFEHVVFTSLFFRWYLGLLVQKCIWHHIKYALMAEYKKFSFITQMNQKFSFTRLKRSRRLVVLRLVIVYESNRDFRLVINNAYFLGKTGRITTYFHDIRKNNRSIIAAARKKHFHYFATSC